MKPPIFIVGASRSGTTLLRLVLNAHSEIGVPPEMSYFMMCAATGQLKSWRSPRMTKQAYRAFVHSFLNHRRVVLNSINLARIEETIIEDDVLNLRRPFELVMETWIRQQGKSRWGEKTPKHLFYSDVLYEMFPDAKFIYLVRDPRAVVHSMNRFPRFTDDSSLNAFNWLRSAREGYDLFANAIPADRRIAVRFEDLVDQPENTLRMICKFIDEPFEPQMLNFHEDVEQHVNPAFRRLGGVQTITKPITRVSADKWRRGLTAHEIAIVDKICGEVMQRFGYEPQGGRLSFSEELTLFGKRMYCGWQWWRNRRARGYTIAFEPFGRIRSRIRNLRPRPASNGGV